MELSFESLETPALTKAHLADLLFEQIGLNKRESKDMIDAFFDLIAQSLVEGTDVKTFKFAPKRLVLGAIPARARRFQLRRAARSLFTPATNSKSKFRVRCRPKQTVNFTM